jgi:formylglycine-generating enzyme required for sulfatase activity
LEGVKGKFSVGKNLHIGKYPITWVQYRAFVMAGHGYRSDRWWEGPAIRDPEPGEQFRKLDNHPAENVSWFDAIAFCRWLSKQMDVEIRLPTEWEWQQAATGGNPDNIYPWGPDWDPDRVNTYENRLSRTTAVGMYIHGVSPVGAFDMSGNVWEWCLNEYNNPRQAGASTDAARSVRGGSWDHFQGSAHCGSRNNVAPNYRSNSIGFRVCCASPIF